MRIAASLSLLLITLLMALMVISVSSVSRAQEAKLPFTPKQTIIICGKWKDITAVMNKHKKVPVFIGLGDGKVFSVLYASENGAWTSFRTDIATGDLCMVTQGDNFHLNTNLLGPPTGTPKETY